MYSINIISINERDRILAEYPSQILYEERADIYGVCIKLLTDLNWVDENWRRNFYSMSERVRSHARMYVTNSDKYPKNSVYYDPFTKTAFLFNFDYYGWIKSIALSLASDVLEDEHGINSVHGACIDINGIGTAIIGASGAGKTTHLYGLMRKEKVRVVADDWFFVRGDMPLLAFSSEKNFYIRADVAAMWPEYHTLLKNAQLDNMGRAIVDLRWVVGKYRIVPFTTLQKFLILIRKFNEEKIIIKPSIDETLNFLKKENYCNPHYLVNNEYKQSIRNRFFKDLLQKTDFYIINNIKTPEEIQKEISKILNI